MVTEQCFFAMYGYLNALRKASRPGGKSGYVVSTWSGQTLQWEPKSPESAEIMRNHGTEPIVAYISIITVFIYNPYTGCPTDMLTSSD